MAGTGRDWPAPPIPRIPRGPGLGGESGGRPGRGRRDGGAPSYTGYTGAVPSPIHTSERPLTPATPVLSPLRSHGTSLLSAHCSQTHHSSPHAVPSRTSTCPVLLAVTPVLSPAIPVTLPHSQSLLPQQFHRPAALTQLPVTPVLPVTVPSITHKGMPQSLQYLYTAPGDLSAHPSKVMVAMLPAGTPEFQ